MANDLSEDGKRRLEAGREMRAESLRQFAERTKGKPTPTQDENDRAMLGEHIIEHEADGSDLDPGGMVEFLPGEKRHLEARPGGGGYQTRQSQAQARAQTPPKPQT